MNVENLEILRDFLLTNDVEFDMENWRSPGSRLTKDVIDKGPAHCGTTGCAVGWAPFVIPTILSDYLSTVSGEVNFLKYSDRVFGLTNKEEQSVFDCDWAGIDNTRQGAAFRIDQLLKGILYNPVGSNDWLTDYKEQRDAWVLANEPT